MCGKSNKTSTQLKKNIFRISCYSLIIHQNKLMNQQVYDNMHFDILFKY